MTLATHFAAMARTSGSSALRTAVPLADRDATSLPISAAMASREPYALQWSFPITVTIPTWVAAGRVSRPARRVASSSQFGDTEIIGWPHPQDCLGHLWECVERRWVSSPSPLGGEHSDQELFCCGLAGASGYPDENRLAEHRAPAMRQSHEGAIYALIADQIPKPPSESIPHPREIHSPSRPHSFAVP